MLRRKFLRAIGAAVIGTAAYLQIPDALVPTPEPSMFKAKYEVSMGWDAALGVLAITINGMNYKFHGIGDVRT